MPAKTEEVADLGPHGVFTAIVTPRRPGTVNINIGAALDIVDFLVQAGVNGLVALGSTGEFTHFDSEERSKFTSMVIKRSRVPVIVNISHSSLRGAVIQAQAAMDSGAAGLLLMPPHFFRYQQPAIREYFLRFADEIGAPTYLYNIPFFTTPMDCETARDLLDSGRFAGIKDSSGKFEYIQTLLSNRNPGQRLIVGNDTAYAPLRQIGSDGVVSGCSCAIPELVVALDRAIMSGRMDLAAQLNGRLHEFIRWIDQFPGPMGVKEATTLRGLPATGSVACLDPALANQLEAFKSWFKEWLPVIVRESAA